MRLVCVISRRVCRCTVLEELVPGVVLEELVPGAVLEELVPEAHSTSVHRVRVARYRRISAYMGVYRVRVAGVPLYAAWSYICVLIYCYTCVLILIHMCPHTAIYVSSYCYICVLILLHMCPHILLCICRAGAAGVEPR